MSGDTEALHEAMSMVRCPYYQHEGKCDQGCYSEPRCITDTPREGWEQRIRSIRAEMAASGDRLSDQPNRGSAST